MKTLMLVLVLFSFVPAACSSQVPPNLNPQATAAWYGTRAIKALDLVRDVAVDGNALEPPLFSTDVTREVVEYHRSAIKIIHETPNGWKSAVSAGLEELKKNLSPTDRQRLGPYFTLVQAILKEVIQ